MNREKKPIDNEAAFYDHHSPELETSLTFNLRPSGIMLRLRRGFCRVQVVTKDLPKAITNALWRRNPEIASLD